MKISSSLRFSGIYCIYNNLNGRRYIGSSKNIYMRLWVHFNKLKNNKHANQALQNAWNLHGEEIFSFVVIEKVDDLSKLAEIEQHYIDSLQCCDCRFGYNITRNTNPQKLVEELGKKISQINTGMKFTQEHKDKIGEATKKRYNIDKQKVLKMYLEGFPAEEIYKECNISKPTLRKIRKEHGILEPRERVYKVRGDTHHLWKGGKPKCEGCGKELSKYKYKRCVVCAGKVYERTSK